MLVEFFDILRSAGGASVYHDIGTLLFARGDDVVWCFVLEDGEVKLSRSLPNGNELVLHRAKAPGIVAEASVYSTTYHCDAVCLSQCIVRKLRVSQFLRLIEEDTKMSLNWSLHLAQSLQLARYRAEILTMNKVSERLDAWLDCHSGEFPPKGKWKEIAAEIGVSAEALYRELARRRTYGDL